MDIISFRSVLESKIIGYKINYVFDLIFGIYQKREKAYEKKIYFKNFLMKILKMNLIKNLLKKKKCIVE